MFSSQANLMMQRQGVEDFVKHMERFLPATIRVISRFSTSQPQAVQALARELRNLGRPYGVGDVSFDHTGPVPHFVSNGHRVPVSTSLMSAINNMHLVGTPATDQQADFSDTEDEESEAQEQYRQSIHEALRGSSTRRSKLQVALHLAERERQVIFQRLNAPPCRRQTEIACGDGNLDVDMFQLLEETVIAESCLDKLAGESSTVIDTLPIRTAQRTRADLDPRLEYHKFYHDYARGEESFSGCTPGEGRHAKCIAANGGNRGALCLVLRELKRRQAHKMVDGTCKLSDLEIDAVVFD